MEIPVIDLQALNGDSQSEAMLLLHQACESWGFFQVSDPKFIHSVPRYAVIGICLNLMSTGVKPWDKCAVDGEGEKVSELAL